MNTQKPNTTEQLYSNQSTVLVTTRVKILLTVLVGIVLSLLVVFVARQQYVESITNRLDTVAALLDPARVKSLKVRSGNAKEDELFLKRQLQQARGVNSDARYLYLLGITDSNHVFYLVSTEAAGTDGAPSRGQAYPHTSDALIAAFYSKRTIVEGPVKDQRGTWLSVISPVYDEAGIQIGVIGMDLPAATYYSVLTIAASLPIIGALLAIAIFLTTDTIRRKRQESLRMRSELVSIASHELRTPLTGIRWGEESLLSKNLIPESRETLQTMYDSTIRLQESIEDILQLANWQAGRKQTLMRASVDISHMINGIFVTQKLPAAQKNITLEFAHDWPDTLVINCDTQRMKRVFNNLISNAIKYATPGTPVTVGYHKVDANHVITIQDHGIGIPKTEQEKVFGGFYRATNAINQEASGTGMGLYMSRNAIEQHDGKLWLLSEEGKGTTVYIQLP